MKEIKEGGSLKTKKLTVLLLSIVLIISVVGSSICAGAVTLDKEALELKPGSLQFTTSQYNLAWLDKLVIRDDANAVTTVRLVPKAEYPYSTTYEQFVEDVGTQSLLTVLNENTLENALDLSLKYFYYAAAALGMTTDYSTMAKYVEKKGIRIPLDPTAQQKTEVAAVYAAIKYKAVYVLYGKNIDFPKGTTIDEAAAVIIASVGNISIPSTVRSVGGLSAFFMQGYISELDEIPLTENPGMDELFYWVRAVSAAKNGYLVPLIRFDETTEIQRQYVDYAYYASILDMFYDVHLDPLALAKADAENDSAAIPKLILTTMLKERNIKYNADAAGENLFDLACIAGCFPLDEEFFSDIYEYDLYASQESEKLWITPFALADQIGGKNENIKVSFGGKEISASKTDYAALNPKKSRETVKVVVTYDDGTTNPPEVTYKFNVIKVKDKNTVSENQNSVVADVEKQIKKVIPETNIKANKLVDGIFEGVNDIVSKNSQGDATTNKSSNESSTERTTYALNQATKSDKEKNTQAGTDSDFSYLNDLFDATYAIDENVTVYPSAPAAENTENENIAQKTAQAIKENPEIVAAPTGVITAGALAGYLFTKKKKTVSESDEMSKGEINTSEDK